MPSQKARSGVEAIKRLLIVRLSAMGDVIHTLPAVAALRDAFPDATLGWVIEERWAELLCSPGMSRCGARSSQKPLVDNVHLVNTKAWRKALLSDRTWAEVLGSVRELRAEHYDAALDFQGAIRSATIAKLARAGTIYGFARPRERVATIFYTRGIDARGDHIVEQNLCLASRFSGRSLTLPSAEFPEDKLAEQQARITLARRRLQNFVMLNPGAGWGAKRWPADRYGEVARRIYDEAGIQSLINYGPGEEQLAWRVERNSGGAAHPVTCTLGELIALTRCASIFIGGDTGPLHLAAALKVPVVAIFGPTAPSRNGPFGTRSIVLRNASSATTHTRHHRPDAGLLRITTDAVLAAALQLLRESRA